MCEGRPIFGQQPCNVGGGSGGAVEEALNLVTAEAFQVRKLVVGFHTFGHNLEFQAVSHGDNGVDDAGSVFPTAYGFNKGLVHFQSVNR